MSAEAKLAMKPAAPPARSPLPFGVLQRKCACGGAGSSGGGECTGCQRKKQTLQRQATHSAGPALAPPIVHEVLRSPGQPLDAKTRAFMEPRFGHDFSKVRVHADRRASDSAKAIDALAYTVGRDVVFAAGRYQPDTSAGRQLMGHELTHVVQQRGQSSTGHPLRIGPSADSYEREAERVSSAILNGDGVHSEGRTSGSVQRQPAPPTPTPPANAPSSGKCLPNVKSFVTAHLSDAQTLANGLGNGVTPAEVLAVAGNETGWGGGFAQYGNFFGLHGSGPAGSYQTTGKPSVSVAKFPVQGGFLQSGQAFVGNVKAYMTPGLGGDPLKFFTVLNQHGYATGNSGYPAYMVATGKTRGPYTLVSACMGGTP